MTNDHDGEGPYRKPRIAAGLGLLLLVFVLFVIGRPPDSLALGLLLGTSLLFLGVEAGKQLLR